MPTKAKLEQRIEFLAGQLIARDKEIAILKSQNDSIQFIRQHISAMTIACERTSEAMAQTVHDVLEYAKMKR